MPASALPVCIMLPIKSYLGASGKMSVKSRFWSGKLTMVQFFSLKKLFLLNLLMYKNRYFGSAFISNFFLIVRADPVDDRVSASS